MAEAKCELCGDPMPPGEEMFKFHGYSGPCPKPVKTLSRKHDEVVTQHDELLAALKALVAMYGPSSDYSYEAAENWRRAERAIAKAESR